MGGTKLYPALLPRDGVEVDDDVVVLIAAKTKTCVNELVSHLRGHKDVFDGVHVGELDPHERLQNGSQNDLWSQNLQLPVNALHLQRSQSMYLFTILLSVGQIVVIILLQSLIQRLPLITSLNVEESIRSNEVDVAQLYQMISIVPNLQEGSLHTTKILEFEFTRRT